MSATLKPTGEATLDEILVEIDIRVHLSEVHAKTLAPRLVSALRVLLDPMTKGIGPLTLSHWEEERLAKVESILLGLAQ